MKAAIAAVVLGFAVVACGTTPRYAGLWEQGDRKSHAYLLLNADRSCFVSFGNDVDAFGGCCRYVATENRIRLTEFEERGALITMSPEKTGDFVFVYLPESDSITAGREGKLTFQRSSADSARRVADSVEYAVNYCGRLAGH